MEVKKLRYDDRIESGRIGRSLRKVILYRDPNSADVEVRVLLA